MPGSLALVLLVAALVPPLWIALAGGADVDVLGARFDFYRPGAPAAALLGCLLLALLGRARGAARALRWLAILAFALAAALCWSAGFETDWIRVRGPDRPALAGAVATIVALWLGRRGLDLAAGARTAAAGALLGALLGAGVLAADRADLARRLEAAAPRAASPDVVFLLLDTLRADALGAYGADPSPSPFLDDLAAESVTFERALSQAPWTAPSVSSLLSSLHPSSFLRRRTLIEGDRYFLLPDGMPWLPALLRDAGYHTAGFVKNPLLQAGTRFERGFDVWEWLRGNTAEHESAAELVDGVLRWADVVAERRARGGAGGFFLYVHFMDPHVQYRPPAEFAPDPAGYDGPFDGGVKSVKVVEEQPGGPRPEDLARMRGLYRGEVAYLDSQLARLQRGLARAGLWDDDTVVVLVADHGEQFFEHGGFMHQDVHWENLHVPFLLRAPGFAPTRVPEPVALLDVGPTLLDLLGLPIPEAMEGRSLVPRMRGRPLPPRVIVSEIAKGKRDDLRLTGPRWSLVTGVEEERVEPVAGIETQEAERDAAVAALREAHAHYQARPRYGVGESEPLVPDRDTERRLRALGYVE